MKRLLSIIAHTLISINVCAGDLMPYTSDGCSSFPDGTLNQKNLWLDCCYEHDKAYWAGGTSQQRAEADNELKACVERVGEPAIAQMMLAGVRVGGSPYFPTSFRWGYGWPYPRGYKPLNELEIEEVKAELKKVNEQ